MVTNIHIDRDNIDKFVESIPDLIEREDSIRVEGRMGTLNIQRIQGDLYNWSFISKIKGMESFSQIGDIDIRDIYRIKHLAYQILSGDIPELPSDYIKCLDSTGALIECPEIPPGSVIRSSEYPLVVDIRQPFWQVGASNTEEYQSASSYTRKGAGFFE